MRYTAYLRTAAGAFFMSSIQAIPENLLQQWCEENGGLDASQSRVQHLASMCLDCLQFELECEQALERQMLSGASALLASAKELENSHLGKEAHNLYAIAISAQNLAKLIQKVMVYRQN